MQTQLIHIYKAVAAVVGVRTLSAKCRTTECVRARWLVWHLARERGHSYPAIARFFEKEGSINNHTTVIQGCKRFKLLLEQGIYVDELKSATSLLKEVETPRKAEDELHRRWHKLLSSPSQEPVAVTIEEWQESKMKKHVPLFHIAEDGKTSKCGVAVPEEQLVVPAMQSDCDDCRAKLGIAPVGEIGWRDPRTNKPKPEAAARAQAGDADEALRTVRLLVQDALKEDDTAGRRLAEAVEKLDRDATEKKLLPEAWKR